MQKSAEMSFADMTEFYLGERVHVEFADAMELKGSSKEYREFIARMLSLMRDSGCSVTDITPHQLWELANLIKNVLPNAWGGRIPPITFPGRHEKIDNLVAGYPLNVTAKERVFIDLGCGFPPVTAVETAKRFPDWRVEGIDLSFAHHIVFSPDGHYACYNRDGDFMYLQPSPGAANAREVYANPALMRENLTAAFTSLQPLLSRVETAGSETVESDGYRLTRSWIRDFETANLSLHETRIENARLPQSDVVRSMNVLVYFPEPQRRRLAALACETLREEGVFIWGTNGMSGFSGRYGIAIRKGDTLTPSLFSFSIDCLRPLSVLSYFTLHDQDSEASIMAQLRSAVRSDAEFWPGFSRRVDEVMADHCLCRRGKEGYLEFPAEGHGPGEFFAKREAVWKDLIQEGFREGMVESLCRTGYKALVNQAGDIAIEPCSHPYFEPISLGVESR